MNPSYQHRQFGSVIAVALFVGILIAALVALTSGESGALTALFFLALAQVLFSSLTVSVDEAAVRGAFGIGLIRFAFPLASIRDARPVTNPWYYGWGIHLTPEGWLFNVSGLEAVELEFATGKKARIGTDEPEALCRAIRERLIYDA